MASQIQINKPYHHHHFLLTFSFPHYPFVSSTSLSIPTKPISNLKSLKLSSSLLSPPSSDKNPHKICHENGGAVAESSNSASVEKRKKKKRVFFLDVNPLCYKGSTPSLQSFAHWISLFFSQVSLSDPVIADNIYVTWKQRVADRAFMHLEGGKAVVGCGGDVEVEILGRATVNSYITVSFEVVDGERGNEYRRHLLPSYKANRRKFSQQFSALQKVSRISVERSHNLVLHFLHDCNVPVVKIESHEADDVVATLVGQVVSQGYQAIIASPDKDFKQLISKDVQIVLPIPEFDRWSFYTLNHYIAQYGCDPDSDLSMRCFLGDEVDGVPGIQKFVPGFGRKTALKLLKKHGSLENLLNAAAVRTVGKQYAQDALTKYADHLRRNYAVLSLKRDINVHIEEQWLSKRDSCNDSDALSNFLSTC